MPSSYTALQFSKCFTKVSVAILRAQSGEVTYLRSLGKVVAEPRRESSDMSTLLTSVSIAVLVRAVKKYDL